MQRSEKFVSASEAAVRLGVSRERLVRLIQRREVPGKLVDGRWLVRASAVRPER